MPSLSRLASRTVPSGIGRKTTRCTWMFAAFQWPGQRSITMRSSGRLRKTDPGAGALKSAASAAYQALLNFDPTTVPPKALGGAPQHVAGQHVDALLIARRAERGGDDRLADAAGEHRPEHTRAVERHTVQRERREHREAQHHAGTG